jgi:hypothetical protein
MKKNAVLCVMWYPAVSTMKGVIWKDVPGADKGLYPAGVLEDKVSPFQSYGGG